MSPIDLAQGLLQACQTQVWIEGRDRVPAEAAIVISNHRSFLDAPILIAALNRPIRFACHYYLSQVPGLREIALGLGCIPLQQGQKKQVQFFRQAEASLHDHVSIGLFPEGAHRIARPSSALEVGSFQSGFAHLALRSRLKPLPILPVAIRVREEWRAPDLPLSLFRYFDPSEPMFQGKGSHPVVIYRQVEVTVAPPLWITDVEQQLERRDRLRYCNHLTESVQQLLQDLVHQ